MVPPVFKNAPLRLAARTLIGLAAVTCAACGRASSRAETSSLPTEVGVVVVHAADVPVSSELTGRVTPTAMAEVRPQVDGIVTARTFVEGGEVRAGQLLYTVDAEPYRAAAAQAAATLAGAEAAAAAAAAQAARYRSVTDADAVSRAQVDTVNAAAAQARAARQGAEANLLAARVNLARTRVLAPISGRIGRSLILPGSLVTARQTTPLAIITNDDAVNVDVEEPADMLLAAKRAMAEGRLAPSSRNVRLKLPDGGAYPAEGALAFTEATVNAETGMAVLRARFPNPAGLLMPGMFVRVETPQGVARGAVLAPQAGVERDAKGAATALVVDARGVVHQRKLTLGDAVADRWLVTSGLADGDELIVEGVAKTAPGSKVRPVVVAGGAR